MQTQNILPQRPSSIDVDVDVEIWFASVFATNPAQSCSPLGHFLDKAPLDPPNPLQEGYYNSINPLVERGAPLIHKPPSRRPHIFTGLEYSGASEVSHTYFPVVQFIGLQYSVMGPPQSPTLKSVQKNGHPKTAGFCTVLRGGGPPPSKLTSKVYKTPSKGRP